MITLVIAQRLGLESNLTIGLSLLEGVCLTIVLMLVAERYLFSRARTSAITHAPVRRSAAALAAADSGTLAKP
jgi:hypothetical protein